MVNSKAWTFEEAKKILKSMNNSTPNKGYILFETGYGPSGLPHIGTFGEVARTTMVINALKEISDIPTRLFAFSDDMDGLRKVPENLPNQNMLRENLGKPLSNIPDPFEKYSSFAEYMNNKLKEFLDAFGFQYEFKSATLCYKSGIFDQTLLEALRKFDQIMNVMLPTLGSERQSTYSPFLPICPKTGIVLQVPIIDRDIDKGTISYEDLETKEIVTVPVTGGHCKLQWKADWAMRWRAFEVDYEMHGKDLIPTAVLSSQICEILGGKKPILFNYELFLDEEGKKISKSKGNGITIDEWLKYASTESLALYMYQAPQKAKRLYFDVIPKSVDEYLQFNSKYIDNDEKKYDNPLWHIHYSKVPTLELYGLNFNLLLNLACACNAEDKDILWGFIKKYTPEANIEDGSYLDQLVTYAVNYYNDFIKPNKKYRVVNSQERDIFINLKNILLDLRNNPEPDLIQNAIYQLGKEHQYENLKDFFELLYQVLLGQTQGPRMGSFVAVYGIDEMIKLIDDKINN